MYLLLMSSLISFIAAFGIIDYVRTMQRFEGKSFIGEYCLAIILILNGIIGLVKVFIC